MTGFRILGTCVFAVFFVVACGGGSGSGEDPNITPIADPVADPVTDPVTANAVQYTQLSGGFGEVVINGKGDFSYEGNGTVWYLGSAGQQRRVYTSGDIIAGLQKIYTFTALDQVSLAEDGSAIAVISANDVDGGTVQILVSVEGDNINPVLVTGEVFETATVLGFQVQSIDSIRKFEGGFVAALSNRFGVQFNSRMLYTSNGIQNYVISNNADFPTTVSGAGVNGTCDGTFDSIAGVSVSGEVLVNVKYPLLDCMVSDGIALYSPESDFQSVVTSRQAIPNAPGFRFGENETSAIQTTDEGRLVFTSTIRSDSTTGFRARSYWVAASAMDPQLLLVTSESIADGAGSFVPAENGQITEIHYDETGWFSFVLTENSNQTLAIGQQRAEQPYVDFGNTGMSSAVQRVDTMDVPPAPYDTTHVFSEIRSVRSLGNGKVAFVGTLRQRGSSTDNIKGIWTSDADGSLTQVHEFRRVATPVVVDRNGFIFEELADRDIVVGSNKRLYIISRDFTEALDSSRVLISFVSIPLNQ